MTIVIIKQYIYIYKIYQTFFEQNMYSKVLNFEEDICQLKNTSIHLIPFKKTFQPWAQNMCRLKKVFFQ